MNQKGMAFLCVLSVSLAVFSCFLEMVEKTPSISSKYFYSEIEKDDEEKHDLLGMDPFGEVQIKDGYVTRSINEIYKKFAPMTWEKYKKFSKKSSAIVKTSLEKDTFVHEKLITTYPFEWSTSMVKDAFIFNLKLAMELRKNGLILIDPTPNNTIFNYTKPVFVDFYGILADDFFPKGIDKIDAGCFKNGDPYIINLKEHELGLFLSFAKAFTLLAKGKYGLAHQVLMIRDLQYVYDMNFDDSYGILRKLCLSRPVTEIYEHLINKVNSISVTKRLDYDYYGSKQENFSFGEQQNWRPKQRTIYSILDEYKPQTVIDIGCNTGWFSKLAEHMGAHVIAIDADEAVVDQLYLYSKKRGLNILPLKIKFQDLDKKYYTKLDGGHLGKSFKDKEFYIAPILRLKSDMTFCLALVHHLVLSMGMRAEKVMNILARITKKVLVLEVPDVEDPLILANLDYYRYAKKIEPKDYGVECFIREGKKYFKKFKIYPSHPKTRTILVFEK